MYRWFFGVVCTLLVVGCDPFYSASPEDSTHSITTTPLGIFVSPEQVVVPQGTEVQLVATGLFEGRETRDLTRLVSWHSANPTVAQAQDGLDAEGRVFGKSLGKTQVWAELDGVQSQAVTVEVTDQHITALSVEPREVVLEVGASVTLQASATWSDGSRSDATGLVRWITDDGAIATLDGGQLTAAGVGFTSVHAAVDDLDSAPVPVEVLAAASPDLRVATLTTTGAGDQIHVDVVLENSGTSGASAFWVDVFLDPSGTPGPGDVGQSYARVDWLGPGEQLGLSFELTASAGFHDVVAVVDIEAEVPESAEGNNQAETSLTLVDSGSTSSGTWSGTGGSSWGSTGTGGTDLAVDRVDWLYDGTHVYYEVEISNYGSVGAGPFWVDLYIDETFAPAPFQDGDDYLQVAWIGAWDTITVEFLVQTQCGWCWSWVQVDSYNEVPESTESDNVYGPIDVY